MHNAEQIVRMLGMQPHPEGGWYVEIHRSAQRVEPLSPERPGARRSVRGDDRGASAPLTSRAAMTSIYYMLERGQRSHWHRVDADELWAWHAGAPMELSIAPTADDAAGPGRTGERARAIAVHRLGMDLAGGERPQAVVPAHGWQSAQPLGEWSLVGCVVAPGFEFSRFEIAPKGWTPS